MLGIFSVVRSNIGARKMIEQCHPRRECCTAGQKGSWVACITQPLTAFLGHASGNQVPLARLTTRVCPLSALQAARRLSVTVSRRASSMYHFFHAKEELRSAKIAALVLAVAFASWGPFVALVSLPEGISLALAAPWLHLASCSLATAFAALSPYVYVFR